MSLVFADSKIGKVIQLEGLIKQLDELEDDYLDLSGKINYSEAWLGLKTILKKYFDEKNNVKQNDVK